MKVLSQSYDFNPGTNQITIKDISNIALEDILIIYNVTDGIQIYSFADNTLGGTLNGNVLTLFANCSAMSSTDRLQIHVDVVDPNLANADLLALLRRMTKLLEPLAVVDGNTRQRVAVETIVMPSLTIGTMPASSGIASATGIGYPSGTANTVGSNNPYAISSAQPIQLVAGIVDQRWQMADSARNTYASGIRSQLT